MVLKIKIILSILALLILVAVVAVTFQSSGEVVDTPSSDALIIESSENEVKPLLEGVVEKDAQSHSELTSADDSSLDERTVPAEDDSHVEPLNVLVDDVQNSSADRAQESQVNTTLEGSAPADAGYSSTVIGILGLSLIVNIILAATALALFRWRKLIVNDQQTLMPESWVKTFASSINKLGESVGQLSSFSASNRTKISDLAEILDTLQRSLDVKDQEIKRYKQGYDAHLYKRFLSKFILTTEALRQSLEKDELVKSDYESILFRLEDAIEDCGVIVHDIEIGSDYRELGGLVMDNPPLVSTEDASQVFKVASLVRSAYILSSGGDDQVIIPAKITVYSDSKGD